MCVFEVAGNQTFKSLLACSVPQLQSDYFASCCDVLTDEIDPDCRLARTMHTFLVGSNSFRMYLAMMELLPTFWSPTSTILNFWIEFRLLEKLILSLILFFIIQTNINKPNHRIPSLSSFFAPHLVINKNIKCDVH